MAYATTSDVQSRLGRPLTEDEETQVSALLEDAEVLIKAKISDLEDQVTDGTIQEAVVIMVESNAVIRVLRNPNGYTSESDGDYSYQINFKLATGSLEIMDKEWALLGLSAGIFMIHPKVSTPYELATTNPYYDPNSPLFGFNPIFWESV